MHDYVDAGDIEAMLGRIHPLGANKAKEKRLYDAVLFFLQIVSEIDPGITPRLACRIRSQLV